MLNGFIHKNLFLSSFCNICILNFCLGLIFFFLLFFTNIILFPLQGRALGVTIGCILGMFPLMFRHNKESEVDEKK